MKRKIVSRREFILGIVFVVLALGAIVVVYYLQKAELVDAIYSSCNFALLAIAISFFEIGYGYDCGRYRKWMSFAQLFMGCYYLLNIALMTTPLASWLIDLRYVITGVGSLVLAALPYMLTKKSAKD